MISKILFQNISAICYTVIDVYAIEPTSTAKKNQIVNFVTHEYLSLTPLLRFLVGLATFLTCGLFWFLRNSSVRKQNWQHWKRSSFAIKVNFVRFYENLVVVALYSSSYELSEAQTVIV